ncbi:hypothetical protein M2281_000164 [Mesorhizobium soli]|uniref:hypothetical protein n=1 Tax=Pseudaminobacter soli (ex Li et al. 2025) TaxID=1295366 RepID=UPI002473D2A3|nr:hypothetical protein [Mesorhizobium soli]MDH6229592.1 hypothetical protein [Mesorhizobium soli]
MRKNFQQAISLGSSCRAKHNMELVFGKHVTRIGRRGVFDWQITPDAALLEYIYRDFSGMFERDDLVVENGHVWHGQHRVKHQHEFPGGITGEQLTLLYPEARAKHDEWARRVRNAFSNYLSTLFVLAKPMGEDAFHELSKVIASRCAHKPYLILPAPDNDNDNEWEGDPEVWKQHLGQFTITPPLISQASYQLRRTKHNLRHIIPSAWRA